LVVALVPGQQRSLDKLKAMREQLSNEVAEVINEFGPKLYDDFDQVYIFSDLIYLWALTLCFSGAS
jgi:glycerol-3-phosphate O-acyltransferase / dihydroxyacetone phosphate acyltransferase